VAVHRGAIRAYMVRDTGWSGANGITFCTSPAVFANGLVLSRIELDDDGAPLPRDASLQRRMERVLGRLVRATVEQLHLWTHLVTISGSFKVVCWCRV
jgi:hypothetical protein